MSLSDDARRLEEIREELTFPKGMVSLQDAGRFLLAALDRVAQERDEKHAALVQAVGGAFRYGANRAWREDWAFLARKHQHTPEGEEPAWAVACESEDVLEEGWPLTCWKHRKPIRECEPCWQQIAGQSVFVKLLKEHGQASRERDEARDAVAVLEEHAATL